MKDEGFVAAAFALFLPIAMVLFSLVMDVAWVSITRGQLQSAADFAALAAVQDLDLDRLAGGVCELEVNDATRTGLFYAWANLEANIDVEALDDCRVNCDIYNPGESGFHGPPYRVDYPIVCIHVTLTANLPLSSLTRTITVHADASLVPRP